ncbi:MAG: hypothetical protein KME26_03535 [Oscillatoria princeps RMCB-10]|nr:hypothetical protein [Oscillatoria princeps RMCB-10]
MRSRRRTLPTGGVDGDLRNQVSLRNLVSDRGDVTFIYVRSPNSPAVSAKGRALQ